MVLRPCGPVSQPECQSLPTEPNSATPSLCQINQRGARGFIDYSPANATWTAYNVTRRTGPVPVGFGVRLHQEDHGPGPGQGVRCADIY